MPVPAGPGVATGTTADLISDTLWHLLGGTQELINRLAADIDADQTTITFDYELGKIADNTVICVGLEEIRVWKIGPLKNILVAERGVGGSTKAAHSAGDGVGVSSRFSPFRILRALNWDLGDLSSPDNGLYQVLSFEFVYQPGVRAYDLAGVDQADKVLEVEWQRIGTSLAWDPVPWTDWAAARDQNLTAFPSGYSLTFPCGGHSGRTYRVSYRAPFTLLSTTELDDAVANTGLPSYATDIPPLGAATTLMAGREIRRNQLEAQGDTRRPDEVPAGAVQASPNGLLHQRQRRIQAEAARLAERYPTRLRRR